MKNIITILTMVTHLNCSNTPLDKIHANIAPRNPEECEIYAFVAAETEEIDTIRHADDLIKKAFPQFEISDNFTKMARNVILHKESLENYGDISARRKIHDESLKKMVEKWAKIQETLAEENPRPQQNRSGLCASAKIAHCIIPEDQDECFEYLYDALRTFDRNFMDIAAQLVNRFDENFVLPDLYKTAYNIACNALPRNREERDTYLNIANSELVSDQDTHDYICSLVKEYDEYAPHSRYNFRTSTISKTVSSRKKVVAALQKKKHGKKISSSANYKSKAVAAPEKENYTSKLSKKTGLQTKKSHKN